MPNSGGGYYDDNGQWQRLKFCFVSCGAACTCMPPGGLFYSAAQDKRETKNATSAPTVPAEPK
jgi:hypothetical protein